MIFRLLQDVGVCWRPQHGVLVLAVGGAVGLAVFEAKPEVHSDRGIQRNLLA
jgi:hypothetical protein